MTARIVKREKRPPKEGDVAKALKKELDKLKDVFYERFEPTPFYGEGRPDFFAIKKGRFIAIETKHPKVGNKLRKSQEEYKRKNLDRVGVPYFVVYNEDTIQEAINFLKGIK